MMPVTYDISCPCMPDYRHKTLDEVRALNKAHERCRCDCHRSKL